jgi:hypothetical protein
MAGIPILDTILTGGTNLLFDYDLGVDEAVSGIWDDYTGVSTAESSAAATAQAQQQSQQFQQQQFTQAQQLAQPFLQGSDQVYGQLINELTGQGPSQFQLTPQYQSAMTAGLDAVNQGAAGAGMLMSGSRLQGLQQTGQNIQNQAYGDYLNRLMSVGSPQTALTLGSAGMGMGQNVASQLMQSQQMQNLAAQQGQAGQQGAINDLIGAGATFFGGGL